MLSGTLAKPKWQLDAKSGLMSGVAALYTGGLSILARGVWDRYLANGDVCAQALRRAGLEATFASNEKSP